MRSSHVEAVLVATLGIALAAVLISIVCAISAFVVQWAWNSFMPAVFGLRDITFGMAFAFMVLCSVIRQATNVTVKTKTE